MYKILKESFFMEEFLKQLDPSLRLVEYQYKGKNLIIRCEMARTEKVCSYCGNKSSKIKETYERKLKDLPFGDFSVTLILLIHRYFCGNENCKSGSFTEAIPFIVPYARITNRLGNHILINSIGTSAIGLERTFKQTHIDISDNTINRIIKKNKNQ